MYLNKFSLRIPEGSENNGYVVMRHGKHYTLRLHNYHDRRCDAEVWIDGKQVGTWRIEGDSAIDLERPVNDDGHFTFYAKDSTEAKQAGQDACVVEELGLVKVIFRLERKVRPVKEVVRGTIWVNPTPAWPTYYWPAPDLTPIITWGSTTTYAANTCGATPTAGVDIETRCCTKGSAAGVPTAATYSPGMTGLSGHSGQQFYGTTALDYESESTTIYLRLVEDRDEDAVRPLRSVTSPIPPPVK